MENIHRTAIIGDNVQIGSDVRIGPYTIIEGNTVIGNRVKIGSHCVIGTAPEHKYLPESNGKVIIGDDSILFQHVAITMPTTVYDTYIGERAFLMGGAHIGHDCRVYDDAIVGGNGMMAGHSMLGEGAFLGDSATIHQWTVIGAYTMIGMNTPTRHNALPFTIIYGSPPVWKNINTVGIDRSKDKFGPKEIDLIGKILKIPVRDIADLEEVMRLYGPELRESHRVNTYLKDFITRIIFQQTLTNNNRGIMVRKID